MTADAIADAIDSLVEASLQEGFDFVSHCQEARRLWALARKGGLDAEVSRILQERSMREMGEALGRAGIQP